MVYAVTVTVFRLCCRPATPVAIPSRAGFSTLAHHDMWSSSLLAACARCGKSLLWDQVSHVAVFYYGAAFALVGIIGLLSVIPARHDPRSTAEAK
jgi:hypothetical protein